MSARQREHSGFPTPIGALALSVKGRALFLQAVRKRYGALTVKRLVKNTSSIDPSAIHIDTLVLLAGRQDQCQAKLEQRGQELFGLFARRLRVLEVWGIITRRPAHTGLHRNSTLQYPFALRLLMRHVGLYGV